MSARARRRGKPAWELVYVNLMTLLMVFFLVLYVQQRIGEITGMAAQYERSVAELQQVFGGFPDPDRVEAAVTADLERRIAAELLRLGEGTTAVEVDPAEIRLTFPTPLLFESGSADIRAAFLPKLARVAALLRELPRNAVVVEGHTDDQLLLPGSRFRSNFELSSYRALSLVHFLIDREGLDPARLTPVGYGEHRPAAPNTSDENRAKNRRIEIHILRTRRGA